MDAETRLYNLEYGASVNVMRWASERCGNSVLEVSCPAGRHKYQIITENGSDHDYQTVGRNEALQWIGKSATCATVAS